VHIGNLRTFLWEDVLGRHLKARYGRVTQVMNLTDVDDKTIRGAAAANLPLREFTEKYTELFFRDIDRLGFRRADHYPRATDYIPQMQEITAKLLEKKNAYESEGSLLDRDSRPQQALRDRSSQGGAAPPPTTKNGEDVKDFVL
jgi:cysteinyl-tRNA synthetase